jgi:hypothetical protein
MRTANTIAIAFAILFCVRSAQAFDCLERASKQIKSGDNAAAVEAVERGARLGDSRCKFILGMWSLSGVKAEKNPDKGLRWLSLAAAQGREEARAYLPAVEGTLTADELELAKADVAKFRPKERQGERRPNKKRLLRLVGLNGPPGEIQRFMGLGGGVDR